MKKVLIALLILVSVSSSAAVNLLLDDQPYWLSGMAACQVYAGACYMPPPSIHQLLP